MLYFMLCNDLGCWGMNDLVLMQSIVVLIQEIEAVDLGMDVLMDRWTDGRTRMGPLHDGAEAARGT